jgi:hypothetical protein
VNYVLPIGPHEPTEETQMNDQIETPEIEETEDDASYLEALAILTSTSMMAERPEA